MTHLRAAAFLVAASVFIPTALSAQASTGSVTGRVPAAGEGVSGAAVLATGTGRGVQTRQDGSYRLVLPPGRYELRARAVGYTSARDSIIVAAGGTYLMNFALEKSITSLEAVSTLRTRGQARTGIDGTAPLDLPSAPRIQVARPNPIAAMDY